MNTKELHERADALRERAARIDKVFESAAIRLLTDDTPGARADALDLLLERAAIPLQVTESQRQYVASANAELHAQLSAVMVELAPLERELTTLEDALTKARNDYGRMTFNGATQASRAALDKAEASVKEARQRIQPLRVRKSEIVSELGGLAR